LPQRLLSDLDDDLLPFLEKIADGRLALIRTRNAGTGDAKPGTAGARNNALRFARVFGTSFRVDFWASFQAAFGTAFGTSAFRTPILPAIRAPTPAAVRAPGTAGRVLRALF